VFNHVIRSLEDRRRKVERGDVTVIPFPFPRLSNHVPGIDRGMYFGITANQKVGKSQLADEMFVFSPYEYWLRKNKSFKLRIFYFSLELSVERKYKQLLSRLLFKKFGYRYSPLHLDSKFGPLPKDVLDHSKEFKEYFKGFEECVKYITYLRTPEEIYRYLERYARENGEEIKDEEGNVTDYKLPDDEFRIVIVDHVSLLRNSPGLDQRNSLGRFSSEYMLRLRDLYKYAIVSVQQQAQSQEGIQNFELKRLQPSVDGLGNNKELARDYDILFGLFSPSRFGIKKFNGYDITRLGNHYRELAVIADRDGEPVATNLYFDGAVNYWKELPPYTDVYGIEKIYESVPKQ